MATPAWTDLLDPSPEAVREHLPARVHDDVFQRLVAPPRPALRPTIQGRGDYVFGVLLAAVVVAEQDRVAYQEVDFVLSHDELLTVRKTPPGDIPFDPAEVHRICAVREHVSPGMVAYYLVNEIAERYLDLLDALDDEVDELERNVERLSGVETQRRISQLRRDLLGIRRTLGPTRDAVRGVVDGRTDIEGRPVFRREVFPAAVERQFQGVYDKLLRATEALDFERDLLASVRDYHQTRIATEQNRVVKALTVVASLLLFPTFLVGVYGQNFEHMPELDWRFGYLFSWAIVVVVTVGQLAFFRWRKWI